MSSAGVSQSQLQAELARKEAALAAMFESGRSMPKASQVAQMRAEISALMDQLAGRPVQPLMPPGAATDPRTGGASTSGPRGGASAAAAAAAAANGPSKGVGIAMAAIAAGGSTGAPRSRADELAFRAYDRVRHSDTPQLLLNYTLARLSLCVHTHRHTHPPHALSCLLSPICFLLLSMLLLPLAPGLVFCSGCAVTDHDDAVTDDDAMLPPAAHPHSALPVSCPAPVPALRLSSSCAITRPLVVVVMTWKWHAWRRRTYLCGASVTACVRGMRGGDVSREIHTARVGCSRD